MQLPILNFEAYGGGEDGLDFAETARLSLTKNESIVAATHGGWKTIDGESGDGC